MGSDNHPRRMGVSLELKKSSPSCLAKWGNSLITVILTLQFLWLPSSSIAGKMDYWRVVMPMTLLRLSILAKRASLTSVLSSHKSERKMGRMCSLVKAFPILGHRLIRFSARAILTYWKVSD